MRILSPIDDTLVWEADETPVEAIPQIMQRSSDAGLLWRKTSIEKRFEVVRAYAKYIESNRDEITSLITREVGKLPWDAAGEVNASIAKAEVSIRAFQERRSDQVIDEGPPTRIIRYQPLGVTLVLGPFNFPLHLPGGQIIPALLAGNSVVMKPSEQASAVAEWMLAGWKAAGLPDDVLQLIHGRVDPAKAAIDSQYVKGVFLTGGRAAGQAIHRQLAGRYDVLLALELGGNNPVVVCGDVQPESVGSTVSFSAFISSGQRCTCARRAFFVRGDKTDEQIDSLVSRTKSLIVGLPDDDPSPQLGPIISAQAAKGLRQTYDKMIELGCTALIPWQQNDRRENLVSPVILDATELNAQASLELAELEWFGPMLIVRRVDDFDAAVMQAASTPYGLSAALLGGDKTLFDRFVAEIGAGVVNWNRATTGAAGVLPFGGLGDSGNHQPAGYFAIDFCSDPVASLESDQISVDDPWSIAK